MSTAALTWAFDQAGLSASEKLVLLVYANFANDRGCAYPSNATVARLSGLNEKTARAAIDRLNHAELLVDTGDRVGRTQQVKVYRLGMESLPETDALPARAPRKPSGVATGPRGRAPAGSPPKTGAFADGGKTTVSRPKGSQNRDAEPSRNHTPENADAFSAPRGGKKRAAPMRSDWKPKPADDLPEPARTIALQWPAGAYAAQGDGHRAHMVGSGRKALDHDELWAARVVQLGASPIRDGKIGLRMVDERRDDPDPYAVVDVAETIARYERMGMTDQADAMRRRAAGG